MNVYILAVHDTYLFAGTDGSGAWQRPLSEMITSVEKISTKMPIHFRLSQNHPNPFNPTTTIALTLPSKSYVTLKVFTVLGKEVATLVDGAKKAGSYQVRWNANRFASGIYIYRIKAGNQTISKRMLPIK